MARGRLYTKEREKGRQLAERLEKKYNNNTLLRLRKKYLNQLKKKMQKN